MRSSFDAADEPEVPRPVLSLFRNADGKIVEGHNRLRLDIDAQEARLAIVEQALRDVANDLRNAAKRTTDIRDVKFPLSIIMSLVLVALAIIGTSKWSTNVITDRMSTQDQRISVIEVKMDALKQHDDDIARLQDERNARTVSDLARIGGDVKMLQLSANDIRLKIGGK